MSRLSLVRSLVVVCMISLVITIGNYVYLTPTNPYLSFIVIPKISYNQRQIPKYGNQTENINASLIEKLHLNWSSNELHDLHRLGYVINSVNRAQNIRNHQFIPDTSVSGIVILIQVHSREKELEILVQSLREVKGIEKTLVVFSHDVFIPSINQIVQAIDFCPFIQLFYPYSLQLYKGHFPADSPNDCLREMSQQKARKIGCSNAEYPDRYGHYREAKFTQMKHHWLWKIKFVFYSIRILKNFRGMLLRIDNDYYLAPDILHVMGKMRRVGSYDSSKMLIMGNHEHFSAQDYSQHTFVSNNWYTGIGRGMGFTKQVWEQIAACSDVFCNFDDYNWDWSLEKVVTTCMNRLGILKPVGSRVFHVGQCQGFHINKQCTPEQVTRRIKDYLNANKNYMFPQNMTFHKEFSVERVKRYQVGYGGWADHRDHQLCKAIFKSKDAIEHTINIYY